MANLKIVLVGGGSTTWTPGLVGKILANRHLHGAHVFLHDIDAPALELTYRLSQMYKERLGSACTFERSTDLDAALAGADYVLVTISTGGLQSMRPDLEIPEKYGIYQCVGDTVGPGGLVRALRNVPVFDHMARSMARLCPDAWMLNLSNPLSALTRVVNQNGVRALGLCHGVLGVARDFAGFFGVPLARCAYVNSGIDHCAWFTEMRVDGRDAWELLEERGLSRWLAKAPAEAAKDETFAPLFRERVGIMVGRELGALPAIGDRHLTEFLPTFLQGEENVARYGLVRTSIADRAENYARKRASIGRILSGEEPLVVAEPTDVLGERQSDDVGAWIAALEGKIAIEDNLNAPNIGQVPQLPLGAIVETRGVLDGAGYHPLASPMPPQIEAIVRPHVLREELTIEAALEGSFDKALAVLASDPLLVRPESARPMLEEMIAATRAWLPQFRA
jgi:alpha-galactosidase/6-phospho-beta-glucosidase family protein